MFLETINVADITSVIWQQQLLSLTQLVFFCNKNYCRWHSWCFMQQQLLSLAKMYFSQRKSFFYERFKLLLYLLYLNNKIVVIN